METISEIYDLLIIYTALLVYLLTGMKFISGIFCFEIRINN